MRQYRSGIHRAVTLAVLVAVQAACGAHPDGGPASAEDPAAWVGRENITRAVRETLEVGPGITGTLEPERQATIRAEVGGAVVALAVEPGQPVDRGAVLARLDDSGIRDAFASSEAQVRTAEMNVELARRNAARAARLAEGGAIADRELETADWNRQSAEAQLEDARARLASAAKQLERTVLRAPFAGVIAERPVRLGDVVQSGAVLLTIIDPLSLQYEGTVPVDALGSVRPGAPVRLTVTGAGAAPVSGRVSRVNPALDPVSRQVRVTVTVPNPGGRLLAGLFAEGRVASEVREGIVVTAAAVDRRGLRPLVMRLKGGLVERVEVDLGLEDRARERIEVVRGLAAGDTLLLGGARGLPPGSAVRVGSPLELPPGNTRPGGGA
jgi:RND family efflux transporter MFP subunit